VKETSRAVDMFTQLHGDMAVAAIKKRHALEYRNALQEVPRRRTGNLLGTTLPEQAAWGREHPEAARVTAATINKQLGGVQAVCVWGSDNGLVPDGVQWSDPFHRLRLPTERSERSTHHCSPSTTFPFVPTGRQGSGFLCLRSTPEQGRRSSAGGRA